jgi:hypothetical protein
VQRGTRFTVMVELVCVLIGDEVGVCAGLCPIDAEWFFVAGSDLRGCMDYELLGVVSMAW